MRAALVLISAALAAPLEYSHVVTQPYRCAPCYGKIYVDTVQQCVDKYNCSQFVYGRCRVRGVFGVESMGYDLVAAGPSFVILSGKLLPDGYLLRVIDVEFEEDSTRQSTPQGVTVSLLSSHTEIVARQIMLKSGQLTSIGQRIKFDVWEQVKPTAYIRLDWMQPKKVRRVVAEFSYEPECASGDDEWSVP